MPAAELIRKYGISQQTFYRWRKKYGGLEAGELRRLKELTQENAHLKTLVADLTLDKQVLQEVLAIKSEGREATRARAIPPGAVRSLDSPLLPVDAAGRVELPVSQL